MSLVDISVICSNFVLVASALTAGSIWLWAALTIARHTRSELHELSIRLDRLAGELRDIVRTTTPTRRRPWPTPWTRARPGTDRSGAAALRRRGRGFGRPTGRPARSGAILVHPVRSISSRIGPNGQFH